MELIEKVKEGLRCCNNIDGHDYNDCPYIVTESSHYCKVERNDDTIEAIRQLEARVPSWISVEESLPERYEHVLVTTRFTDEGEPDLEIAYLSLNRWTKEEGHLYGRVTHWMPLPEPPET